MLWILHNELVNLICQMSFGKVAVIHIYRLSTMNGFSLF